MEVVEFEAAPKSAVFETRNYDDARLYCFSLNLDGKTGWRLPTKDELNQIYKSSLSYDPFIYLTSTKYEVNPNHYAGFDSAIWVHKFYNGQQTYYLTDRKIPFNIYKVIPVRDILSFRKTK